MSLIVKRRLFIVTPDGEREIQLCFGDITNLPAEDKVDVIMISAFKGDYAPVKGTLIHALHCILKLDVQKLASDCHADLRKNFHCWISQLLPSHLPYRQLVCFEKYERDSGQFDEAVAQVFRAMMPVFNNCDKSVITPLLACGRQAFDECLMLKALLSAAVEWILAGLPLQLLKIVIYSPSPEYLRASDQEKIEIFKKFEETAKALKTPPLDCAIKNDVYMIYAEADQDLAHQVTALLRRSKRRFGKSVKIVSVSDIAADTASWQHDVVTAMMESGCVVPLLTSSFLSDDKCVDQFNLALCADRRTKRNLLTPVAFGIIAELPDYMRSVQLFLCKSGDPDKIEEVCQSIIGKRSRSRKSRELPDYDVFISYSHCQSAAAKLLLNALVDKRPDIRIFFDNNELKTGDQWQLVLYKSINFSKCVIILLSQSYLASPVCNEELNLTCARRMIMKDCPEIIVVCLEEVDSNLPLFSFINNVQYLLSIGSLNKLCNNVALSIDQWLTKKTKDEVFASCKVGFDCENLNKLKRVADFKKEYSIDSFGYVHHMRQSSTEFIQTPCSNGVSKSRVSAETIERSVDVFLSYAAHDKQFARFLSSELQRRTLFVVEASTARDPEKIDKAKCVVVLLSMNYVKSLRKIGQLNLALSRARSGRSVYFIAVERLPASDTMTYIQLVECSVCLSDEMWCSTEVVQLAPETENIRRKVESTYGKLSVPHILALMKAACDITASCRTDRVDVKTRETKGSLQSVTDLCFATAEDHCVFNGGDVFASNENRISSENITSESVRGKMLPDAEQLADAIVEREVDEHLRTFRNQRVVCSVL